MIKRIVLAITVAALIAPFAFSQMRYSRTKSAASPTPTPSPTPGPMGSQRIVSSPRISPTPVAQQRTGTTQTQQFIPARKGAVTPTPPPSGAMQRIMSGTRPTPTPMPQQQQRAIGAQTQSQFAPQRTGATIRATPTPMPQQRVMNVQTQSQVPAQRTVSTTNQTRTGGPPRTANMPSQPIMTPAPVPVKPTPTPVPPPDIKTYLDRQIAKSKDQKFHMTVNGGDLGLTPFHVWPQKTTGPNATSTAISMRSDDGRVYDIEFLTVGAQVTAIRIARINGEGVR